MATQDVAPVEFTRRLYIIRGDVIIALMRGFSLLLRSSGAHNLYGCLRLARLVAASFVIIILGCLNRSNAELTNLKTMPARQVDQDPTPLKQAAQSTTLPSKQAAQSTVPQKLRNWAAIKISGHYTRLNIRTLEGNTLELSLDTPDLDSYLPLLAQSFVDSINRLGGLSSLSRRLGMKRDSIDELYKRIVINKTPPKRLNVQMSRLFFILNKAQEFLKSNLEQDQKNPIPVTVPTENKSLYLNSTDIDKFIENLEPIVDYINCIVIFLQHNKKQKQFSWYRSIYEQNRNIKNNGINFLSIDIVHRRRMAWPMFDEFLKRVRELHQFYDPQEVLRTGVKLQHIPNKLNVRRITPKELLDRFSHDVTKKDLFRRNILFYAVKTDPLPKIKQLVERGVAVDVVDVHRESPLEWAIFLGRIDVVQYLWPRVKKPKRGRLRRNKWLKDAVLQGHNEVAAFLLTQGLELHDMTWPEVYEYNYIRDRLEFVKWLDVLAERGVFTPPQIEHLTTARAHYIQAFADRYPALARELHNHNSETNAQPAIETDVDVGAETKTTIESDSEFDAEAKLEMEFERWLAQQPPHQNDEHTDCTQLLSSN